MGVSSPRLLALPAFLASAVGAKDALCEIFGLEHVDGTYDDALKRWFELGKTEMLRKMKSKNWTEPIFDNEIADLILRLGPTDVKKIQRVPRKIWLPMVERHPVQKFKVKTVEPTTHNCDRTSIRFKNMLTA